MALSIGIVGLPNVGKSTMFNALTKNNVLAANYPFATIEPNVGVVPLPDSRLGRLAEIFGSEKILPATVSFVDIAGIVRGASEGEGLGNKFLANIRESDAICQVVRAFVDDDVTHVDGKIDPASDMETINTELVLADLQTLESAIPRIEKEVKGKKTDKEVLDTAIAARGVLEAGDTLFAKGAAAGVDMAIASQLGLLTTKPFLYVFNVDEDQLTDTDLQAQWQALVEPAEAIFLNAKLESEVAELDDEDARELLEGVGIDEPGLDQLARKGFNPSGCRPTSPPAPRSRARGRSTRATPRPRPPASSTPTSSAASSRPRSSPSRTSTRSARWPRRRPPARCAWRARTTSWLMATWWSSASTCSRSPALAQSGRGMVYELG